LLGRIKQKLTYANLMATIAVFAVLGGGAYAAATIGAGDIKPNAVRAKHVKKGAVGSVELRDAAVKGVDLGKGIPRGIEYVDDVEFGGSQDMDASVECPEGKVPIGGGASGPWLGATGFVAITTNRPAIKDGFGDDFDGWYASAIEVNGGSTQSWGLGVYAICARL
jgi:hypothetical protein